MAEKLDLSNARIVRNVEPQAPSRNYSAIDAVTGGRAGEREEGLRGQGPGSFGRSGLAWMGPAGDEFGAGLASVGDYVRGQFSDDPQSLGDLYRENLEMMQGAQAAYREQAPIQSFVKEATFGLAALQPGSAVYSGLSRLGQTSFGSRLLSSLGWGAAGGGAAGFAEGQGGLRQRVESGIVGAGIGAATGGALQTLGEGVNLLAQGVSRVRGLRGEGAQRRAAEMLEDALQKDGVTPEMVKAAADSGKPFTLADMGPNTRALMGSAYRFAGKGKTAAEEFFEGRTVGQFDRMDDDLMRLSGFRGADFNQIETEIAKRRAAQAGPGYREAYKIQAPDLSDDVQAILKTPAGNRAVAKAKVAMKDYRAPVKDKEGRYTVQMLDQIQRQMKDFAGVRKRQGASETARRVGNLRDEFLEALPEDLRNVMRMYASESDLIDAMRSGRRFLLDEPDDMAVAVGKLAPAERAMFRLGAARALRGKMSKTRDGADVAAAMQEPAFRERINAVFDNVFQAQDFIQATRTERIMQETRNAILKGSPTAPRMVDDEGFASSILGDAAADAVRGGASTTNVMSAIANAAMNAARAGKERLLDGLSEEVGDRLSVLMTNPNLNNAARAIATRPPRPLAPPQMAFTRAVQAPLSPAGYAVGARATQSEPPQEPPARLDLSRARVVR